MASGHTLNFDQETFQASGVTINAGATLTFLSSRNGSLLSSANVIVYGRLVAKPAQASIVHVLKFTSVNEANFVGGGMDPLTTDVGLWVMGSGQLDMQGTPKSGWLRFRDGVEAGATSATLDAAPISWQQGDEIVITPTESPAVGAPSYAGFEEQSLSTVSGNTITWNSGTDRAHPKVNDQWTAEVANLTRNVRIEGAADSARSHIFIRSSSPQAINYVGIRYMGPRQASGSFTEVVLGRYALHFHHSEDGSRGSQVFGTVVRDGGSHAFVPHKSHGVWFRDTIAYNNFEDPYWWDGSAGPGTEGDETHDTVFDHAMAALVKCDPPFRGYRLSGFSLTQGLRNVIRDSVAVGVQGTTDSSGFKWPESTGSSIDSTVWDFSRGNIAHNNSTDGFFIWQNNSEPHVVSNFSIYHNGEYGVQHGAYGNNYHYENAQVYGNGKGALYKQAISAGQDHTAQQHWKNIIMDGGGVSDYLIVSEDHTFSGASNPTRFRNVTMKGAKVAALHFAAGENANPDELNFEFPTVETPSLAVFTADSPAGNIARIQTDNVSAQISQSEQAPIPTFALPDGDHGRPQISITSPSGGSTVSGTIELASSTYDDFAGIDRVDAFVDGVKRAYSEKVPFTVAVDTSGLGDGMHIFELRASDKAGRVNTGHRTSYWVIGSGPAVKPVAPINDDVGPEVDLFTPAKNSDVNGYYQMTSEASDDYGIAKVEFYADSRLICADDKFPFDGCLWNSWETPNGTYAVSAKAYDFNGRTEIDDFAGNVTVFNMGSPSLAPPVPAPDSLAPPSAMDTTAEPADGTGRAGADHHNHG